MAQDALEAIQLIADKIRESIRFLKRSLAIQWKFNEVAKLLGFNSKKRLLLDCTMQWNSTLDMLETALEYKKVFSALKEYEPDYTMGLTEKEWERATTVTSYVKLFMEVINVFKSSNHHPPPTANICFPEICDIYIHLIEWCKSSDEFICSLALELKAKLDKYWIKCSFPLAVAVILDPRFKMRLVEYFYPQIYGNDDYASNCIKDIYNGIRVLFSEYYYCLCTNSVDHSFSAASSNGCSNRLMDFENYLLHETSQTQSITSDLDKYLEEPVFPRRYDFNVLNWWKVHTPRYPILSMMARDILGIPLSIFSHELVGPGRSATDPDFREVLVCGQDWLRTEEVNNEKITSLVLNAVPIVMDQS